MATYISTKSYKDRVTVYFQKETTQQKILWPCETSTKVKSPDSL